MNAITLQYDKRCSTAPLRCPPHHCRCLCLDALASLCGRLDPGFRSHWCSLRLAQSSSLLLGFPAPWEFLSLVPLSYLVLSQLWHPQPQFVVEAEPVSAAVAEKPEGGKK